MRLTNSSSEVEPGSLQILEVALEDCHSLRVGQLQEMLPLSSHSLILSLLPCHLLTEGLECNTGTKLNDLLLPHLVLNTNNQTTCLAYSSAESGFFMLSKVCYMFNISSVISILFYTTSCATVPSSLPLTLPHVFYLRYKVILKGDYILHCYTESQK